jgi:hypothetical protein
MKSLLALTASCLLLVPLAAPARSVSADHTELEEKMEAIEEIVKRLRRDLGEEVTHAQALEALVELERLSLDCKGLQPAFAERLPEAERASFVHAYRREMVKFLSVQLELEAALLDGDADATTDAFKRLRAMEDEAHERFAPEEY